MKLFASLIKFFTYRKPPIVTIEDKIDYFGRSVLGAIMEGGDIKKAATTLTSNDFIDIRACSLWNAMIKRYNCGNNLFDIIWASKEFTGFEIHELMECCEISASDKICFDEKIARLKDWRCLNFRINTNYHIGIVGAIINKADIVKYATQFMVLQKENYYYKGLCPIHTENTPSFNIDPAKKLYKCFGCGATGNIIDLAMVKNNMSYPAAVYYVSCFAGINL